MLVDWKKWGLGISLDFHDPAFLRVWIGPVRMGVRWGRDGVPMVQSDYERGWEDAMRQEHPPEVAC